MAKNKYGLGNFTRSIWYSNIKLSNRPPPLDGWFAQFAKLAIEADVTLSAREQMQNYINWQTRISLKGCLENRGIKRIEHQKRLMRIRSLRLAVDALTEKGDLNTAKKRLAAVAIAVEADETTD